MRGAADGLPPAAANVAWISVATSGEAQFCVDPAYRASLGSRKSWKLRDYLVAFHIEARPFIYLGSAHSLSLGKPLHGRRHGPSRRRSLREGIAGCTARQFERQRTRRGRDATTPGLRRSGRG